MKVLVVRPGPGFSVMDVARGWVNGFERNGCAVADFNFDDRLNFYEQAHILKGGEYVKAFNEIEAVYLASKAIEAVCYELDPDVVVFVSGFFIPPPIFEIVRARGAVTVLLHTESPYEDDIQQLRARHVDWNVLNDPTNIDDFPNAHYFGHAYDPQIHRPTAGRPEHASDFFFCGTGYDSRQRFFEQVDFDGIDTLLAGNWQELSDESPLKSHLLATKTDCLDNDQAVLYYAATKASANLYRKEANRPDLDQGWSMGPREVELAACGTFYLTEARGENRDVLPMVPTFSEPDEFGEKLRWYLARPAERDEITREARAAIADRTFEASAARLLRLITNPE